MKAGAAERMLIFRWDRVRRVPVILPGFLLLSFVGHVGAFFLFRVVYPPQASLPMPPPAVTLLDPSRPDHQALLRWAEAEDSSPAAAQTGLVERLLEVPYRPSYATARTAPLTLSPQLGQVQYPPARDPLTLIRSVEPKPAALPPPPAPAPSRVIFGGPLAERTPADTELRLSGKSAEPLEAAEFLVGATDRGELRFVVLQHSSGNEALDTEAAEQLSQMQLAKGGEPVSWGRVTVHWGADAYTAKAK